jgi:hypothetical protein
MIIGGEHVLVVPKKVKRSEKRYNEQNCPRMTVTPLTKIIL